MTKRTLKYAWALVPAFAFGFVGCDVEQTEEGRAPDVDVDVKGDPGELPEYDVETKDVEIRREEREVEVPTGIDIQTEQRRVTLPDFEVRDRDEVEREVEVERELDGDIEVEREIDN